MRTFLVESDDSTEGAQKEWAETKEDADMPWRPKALDEHKERTVSYGQCTMFVILILKVNAINFPKVSQPPI